MLLTMKFMLLAALYVGTGGAVFTEWGQRHSKLVFLAGVVAVIASGFLFRDIYETLKSDVQQEVRSPSASSLPITPSQPVESTLRSTSKAVPVSPRSPEVRTTPGVKAPLCLRFNDRDYCD